MHSVLLDRMRTAIGAEEADRAIKALREMDGWISPWDVLDLVRLLARKADPRFDAFADRWLARFVVEEEAPRAQLRVAMAAMSALAFAPDDENVIEALRASTPPLLPENAEEELRETAPGPRADFGR